MAAATPTSPDENDVVLKDLPNPLYTQHSTNTLTSAEYEVPHQQAIQPRALANPAYGIAERRELNEDLVSTPMYGLTFPQHSAVNDHVYNEAVAQQESHIYDAPAKD